MPGSVAGALGAAGLSSGRFGTFTVVVAGSVIFPPEAALMGYRTSWTGSGNEQHGRRSGPLPHLRTIFTTNTTLMSIRPLLMPVLCASTIVQAQFSPIRFVEETELNRVEFGLLHDFDGDGDMDM